MWLPTFNQRLASWNQLRSQCRDADLETALKAINTWWFSAPWQPYYLHWDDVLEWPDPWQLLSDNAFCDVARGLGILYTVSMLEREDMADVVLISTESGDNLVLASNGKYILNWDRETIVNTTPKVVAVRQLTQQQIK